MNDRQINSVALYFGSDDSSTIPHDWISNVTEFFESHNFNIDYFDVSATEFFSQDEVYQFDTHKGNLAIAVESGHVESIGLYSIAFPNARRTDWSAMASVEIENGMMFLGLEDARLSDQEFLLRSAYDIGGKSLGTTYGISFKAPIAHGPDSYAAGVQYGGILDVEPWITTNREIGARMTAWRNEKYGRRSYLRSKFRGAYCASIISGEHLRCIKGCAQALRLPGAFIPFVTDTLWIWSISASDIVDAERILHECGLLIE